MPRVPARACRQRHPQLPGPHPCRVVAVGIEPRNERHVRRANFRWQRGDAAVHVGPEVEPHGARDALGETNARDGLERAPQGLRRDRGPLVDARHGARWRLRALAGPAVEVHQGGAEQRRVVDDTEQVATAGARVRIDRGRRDGAGCVLRAGVQVHPDVRGRRDVRLPHHVRVHERGVAPPVLGGGVDREHLRRAPALEHVGQQGPAPSRHQIILLGVGEGKEVADAVPRVQRRLAEAQVELAATRTGDVRDRAVEDQAPRLVLVETEMEQVAQEAPALGDAEDVGVVQPPRARVAALRGTEAQEPRGVADRREAETDDGRILRLVVAVVDLARLEAAGEPDVRGVRRHRAAHGAGEPPGAAVDRHCGRPAVLAYRQLRAGVVQARDGIRDVIAVREGQRRDRRVRVELAAHAPGDTRHARDRERHHVVLARHVGLPAHPRDGPAVAHEEAVAEVLPRRRVVRAHDAVEQRERHLSPTVGHVEQEPPAPPAHRPQQIEVGPRLDQPPVIPRGPVEVGDRPIRGQRRIHGEANHTDQFLVGARLPERGPREDGLTPLDLQSHDCHENLLLCDWARGGPRHGPPRI